MESVSFGGKSKNPSSRNIETPEGARIYSFFLITKLRAFGASYLVSHRHRIPYKPRGIYYSNNNATVKLARNILFPFWREYRRGVLDTH